MSNRETGSSLISILAGIIILTIMVGAIMTLTIQGTMESGALLHGSRALMYARTGLQNIYQEMHIQWDGDGGTNGNYPDGIWNVVQKSNNLTTIENALNAVYTDSSKTSLMKYMQQWIQDNANANWSATIQPEPGGNNFATAKSISDLYQKYDVTVTGKDGTSTATLSDVFTISAVGGVSPNAIAAQNVFITGAPVLKGQITAKSTVFFNNYPWYLEYGQAQYTKVHKFSSTIFAEEPSGYEQILLPDLTGSSISSPFVESFLQFKDQTLPTDATSMFGDDSQVSGVTTVSNISTVATGNPTVTLGSTYSQPNVATIVGTSSKSGMYGTLLPQAQAIGTYNTGDFNKNNGIPQGSLPNGGYIHYNNGNDYQYTANQMISKILVFSGTLVINQGASLSLTQPMFVDGNLIIQGNMTSTSPIYVTGSTRISSNLSEGSQLQIYSIGDIDMDIPSLDLSTQQPTPPNAAITKVKCFFASGGNVYIAGMESAYSIQGGAVADGNIMINGTVGLRQTASSSGVLHTSDNDTTRRLQFIGDTWYQSSSPLSGPTTLALQAMPQPTLVTQ